MGEEIQLFRFSKNHIDDAIRLHLTCFKSDNNISLRLGEAFLRKTYTFFIDDSKSFGFIAYLGKEPVGMMMGRLDYYVDALNAYRKGVFIKSILFHPSFFFDQDFISHVKEKIKSFFSSSKNTVPDVTQSFSYSKDRTATLASFASDPNYAKMRIADKLIDASVAYCKEHHMQYLRAGIARSNVSSRFAFSKKGFKEDKPISTSDGMFYYIELI